MNADNAWFNHHFPDGQYQDVEGLCKVVNTSEIEEQDYSLTPGRYVGVSIDVDMDFDYKGRMVELYAELAQLNEGKRPDASHTICCSMSSDWGICLSPRSAHRSNMGIQLQ